MATQQVKSIFIINAVLANTGDAALMQALVALLEARYPGAKVYIATHHHKEMAKLYPKLILLPNFEHAIFSFQSTMVQKFFNQVVKVLHWTQLFPWILTNAPCISAAGRQYLHTIRSADLVISSPGGYLHDHYGIDERLAVFRRILSMNKRIYLIGQSFGPFWKTESFRAVRSLFPRLDIYAARESYSARHLLDLLGRAFPYFPDLAWTLAPQQLPASAQKENTLVINVRPWDQDDAEIRQKFKALCIYLLENTGFELVFLSTVQGLPFYRSDVDFFKAVLEELPYQNRIRILDEHHSPGAYMQQVFSAHAYIGMRLHGAILSMLGGVPAFHISYEDKGLGTYEMLDFQTYCISYTESGDHWISAVEQFLADVPMIKDMLPQKCKTMAEAAKKHLEGLPIPPITKIGDQ